MGINSKAIERIDKQIRMLKEDYTFNNIDDSYEYEDDYDDTDTELDDTVKLNHISEIDDDYEKEMIKAEMKNDEKNKNKPEDILDKMAVGKLGKFFKENCLVEQAFIKDSSLTVEKYVKENGGEVVSMTRFAVGEGIEKKQENFAEEVMSQINAA